MLQVRLGRNESPFVPGVTIAGNRESLNGVGPESFVPSNVCFRRSIRPMPGRREDGRSLTWDSLARHPRQVDPVEINAESFDLLGDRAGMVAFRRHLRLTPKSRGAYKTCPRKKLAKKSSSRWHGYSSPLPGLVGEVSRSNGVYTLSEELQLRSRLRADRIQGMADACKEEVM